MIVDIYATDLIEFPQGPACHPEMTSCTQQFQLVYIQKCKLRTIVFRTEPLAIGFV